MPWDWQPRLKTLAESLGMDCFSSPFDPTAVDFLAALDVPAFKVASFELVDLPLIRRMAATGKPLIISTGMGTEAEIDEAVAAARAAGATEIALLKCTSAYPSPPEAVNLRAIAAMRDRWGVPIGLSDHTLGETVADRRRRARRVHRREAHAPLERGHLARFARSRWTSTSSAGWSTRSGSPSGRSGRPVIGPTEAEQESRRFRRSLFVVADVAAGEALTEANVRSIRPADGLHTRHYDEVLGRRAARAIERGTPLSWDLIEA